MEWASRSNATSYKTLFSYLAHHSHSYFSNRFAGSLSSKISHASEGVQSLFEAILWNYYSSVLSLIITTVFMFSTSLVTGGLFLGLIVILVPLNVAIARYRRPHVVEFSAQATRARGYAVDAISNMITIRQYARTNISVKCVGLM
jgi:ATP-binding cassette subfamily B protein